MSRTITDGQRLQAIGLLTIAGRLNSDLKRIEREFAAVVGEPPDQCGYAGIASDTVMEALAGSDAVAAVDVLLERLEVTVESLAESEDAQ